MNKCLEKPVVSAKHQNPAGCVPLLPIQKLIGKRMLRSKTTKPCFYLEAKADVTDLVNMRPRLRKALGVKITTNAFYIRCLSLAVRDYPLIIGRLNETAGTVEIPRKINVGFAVNAPQGLVVPVIKNADTKTLAEIAEEEKYLTECALSDKLMLKHIEGENIALSNLGVYGIDTFFGISPPPATAILAIGNIVRTVVAENGNMVWRKMLSLTLAVDHKIVNGDYASKFLVDTAKKLEEPEKLIS